MEQFTVRLQKDCVCLSALYPNRQRVTLSAFIADLMGPFSVPKFPTVRAGWELHELLNTLVSRQKASYGFLFAVHPQLCYLLWVQIEPLHHLLHVLSHLQQLEMENTWNHSKKGLQNFPDFHPLPFLRFACIKARENLKPRRLNLWELKKNTKQTTKKPHLAWFGFFFFLP